MNDDSYLTNVYECLLRAKYHLERWGYSSEQMRMNNDDTEDVYWALTIGQALS